MNKLSLILLSSLFLAASTVYSQIGYVDTTFNVQDNGTYLSNFNSDVREIEVFANGDYLIAGYFTDYNGIPVNGMVKLNNDGTIDPSFNIGVGPNGGINGFTRLSNGKLIVFGEFDDFNGVSVDSVVRLLPDGSVDGSFQLNTGAMKQITDVVELSNGDLVISGGIIPTGSVEYTIIKTSADGTVNTSFAFQPFTGLIKKLYVDDQEDVYILGGFYQIAGYSKTHLAKMDSSGIVYGAYTVPPYAAQVNDMVLESDGSLIVCGSGGTSGGFFKTLPNGQQDTSFDTSPGFGGTYQKVVKDSLGRFYFLWTGGGGNGTIRRTNSNGTIVDDYFYTLNDAIQNFDALIDPAGKLVTARADGIRRHLQNGLLDPEFNLVRGSNDEVSIVRLLPSGKTIVAGKFTAYNGVSRLGMARLMPNGELDLTFDPGVNLYDAVMNGAEIRDVEIQNDGKIIIGGQFNSYTPATQKNLMRLNADGTLDSTFVIGNGLNGPVNEIVIRPDQKIIIGGEFIEYDQFGPNQQMLRSIGVLQSNGLPDPTSQFGSYPCSPVKTIELLPNGQLLLGGQIFSYNFQSVSEIIRLNTNASLDPTFDIGTGVLFAVNDLELQSSGKIIVASSYEIFNGDTVDQVFRIHPNGILDTTFYSDTVFSSTSVEHIEVLDNDQILAIGGINGGTGGSQLVRLTIDGEIDTTFYYSTSIQLLNQNAIDFAVTPQNDIVIGGEFNEYNGYGKNSVTRIFGDSTLNNCIFFTGQINNVSNLSCSDSSVVSVMASNGVAPYLYSWDNGAYNTYDTLFITSQSGVHQISFMDSLGCVFDIDYLINGPVSQGGFDVDAHAVASQFRPGFSNVLVVDAFNDGCLSVDGDLTVILDTTLIYNTSIPIPDTVLGDTLVWNFTDLGFDSTHLIPLILYTTPTTAQIGDSISIITRITPFTGDVDTTNNVKHYSFPVVNGYDPNDKKVYPVGECIPNFIDQGEPLTYTVRFQNTGNSEAINIFISDSLPSEMDMSTLRVLASSHPMHTEVYTDNRVKFVFNDINLPDSMTNPNGSIGYVIYELDQNGYLYPYTEIKNKAEIYFDFNPPIITNEVFNTVFEDYEINQETIVLEECDSLLWNGNYYYSSGIYSHVSQNIYGCDSIEFLNLVINESTSSVINESGLDSVVVNNQTFFTSGAYEQTLINFLGCDSVVTINVTLQYSDIDELGKERLFTFPNPTNGKITFELDKFTNNVSVSLISQEGRVLEKYSFQEMDSGVINIKESSGVYFLHFLLDGEIPFIVRVVKE